MSRRAPAVLLLSLVFGLAACDGGADPTAPLAPELAPAVPVAGTVSTGDDAATLDVTTPDNLFCSETADVTVEITGSTEAQPLDVIVLMDGSGSVGATNFAIMKNEVANLIDQFTWSAPGNHMGMFVFSTNATQIYSLADAQSNTALKNAVNGAGYPAGWTDTREAVQGALDMFGAAGRVGAQKVLILISDGAPALPSSQGGTSAANPCPLAPALQNAGVETLIVGIGSQWDPTKVECLVSDPDEDIIGAGDFSALGSALADAINQIPVASDVSFSATIPAGFSVSGTPSADAGTVTVSGNEITWELSSVGDLTRTMEFQLAHDGATGGSVPALTDIELAYTSEAQGQVTNSAADAVIQVDGCDTTPPVITPSVVGTLGDNDWYVSDVDVSWTVEDPESAFTIDEGCTDETLGSDTDGVEYSCTATSDGGTATETVTIKRDAADPVIAFAGNAGSYLVTEDVAITCDVSDATSGVATADCDGLAAPAWSLGVGSHSVEGSATDNAGNDADASTGFEVVVTYDALGDLVDLWVSNNGVANSLTSKLANADRAAQRGNAAAAASQIAAFINEVEAQAGKKIDAELAAILIALAEALL